MTGEADAGAAGSETGGGETGSSGAVDTAPTNAGGSDNPSLDTSNDGVSGDDTGAQEGEVSDGGSEYSLPEEYKDKSWADKIKSEGDLYKQIDNLTELVGKKTIAPIDYDSATPEQVADYHKSLVPEDASAYKFSEDADPEFSKAMIPELQKAGVHPAQLAPLETAINKIASDMVGAQHSKDRSEEGYFELTEKAFGENHKDVVVEIEGAYKDHVSDETKAFLDNASNTERVAFDQTVKSIIDAKNAEIAKIREEYGAEESGLQGEGEPANRSVNIDDQIAQNSKEINEINNSRGQKDWSRLEKLKQERKDLFTKKVKLGK